MNKKALKVINLSYSYDNTVDVLKNVTFSVNAGSFVSIIGHNGSGKSTLAKLLAGILDMQDDGEIYVFDELLQGKNTDKIRQNIGIVFQNPDNQFIGATVRDDIAFGLENRNIPTADMDAIIDEYAKKVGMTDFLEKEPGNLSGGQKQRVALAGVLAMKPKILLLDEATAMLDPQGKREVKEIIYELRKEIKDLTILSITHDIEDTIYSDEIIVLNQGQIVLQGTPEEVYAHHDQLMAIKLGVPFTYKIKLELAKQGMKIKGNNVKDIIKELWP